MTSPKNDRTELKKVQQNSQSKVLFSNIASMLVKKTLPEVKLKGSPEQIAVVESAIAATREFHDKLNDPNANLESIMSSLNKKHEAARAFKQKLGIDWAF